MIKFYFSFLALMISFMSQAQFMVGAQVGMNIPTAGIALPGFVQIERDGTQKALVATLGAGLNYNGMVGYQFNDNVIANLDFGYFSSFKGSFYQYGLDVDLDGDVDLPDARADLSFKGTFTHITPSIILQATGKEKKMRPYARFGFIVGWAAVEATTKLSIIGGKRVDEYSGGTSFGFLGAIGMNKQLSDKLSLFFELTTKTVTAYPKQLANLENFGGPKDPTIKFIDEVKANSPATNQLTFPLPYSSVGLSVGLTYKLGSK